MTTRTFAANDGGESGGKKNNNNSHHRNGRGSETWKNKSEAKDEFSAKNKNCVVEARQLKKTHDGERYQFDGLDFSLSEGQKFAVVGPNGAGKTTLLRLVGGDAGPVIVKAGSSGSVTSHRQLRRALMNQHHIASLESMMELSSVGVMQRHRRATQGTGLTAGAARQLLGGFGLPGDLALMPISLLSGGQKARLSMACAVNHTPHLLALDEPTNHLDVSSRAALIAALGEFNGGIVLVSHDAHFLKQVCNELWIVKDGRVRVVKGNFARAFDTYCAPKKVREKKAASGGQRRQHVARGRFD